MVNKWNSSLSMESQISRGLRSVALVLATLVLVTNAEARPRHECAQGDLEGVYGYAVTGPLVGVGPVAVVGLASFDGEGGLTAKDTVSTNGKIVRRTGRGSYVVNANLRRHSLTLKQGQQIGRFVFTQALQLIDCDYDEDRDR